jgi:hypothetical protein
MLTPAARRARWATTGSKREKKEALEKVKQRARPLYLLYWYKSTNADTCEKVKQRAREEHERYRADEKEKEKEQEQDKDTEKGKGKEKDERREEKVERERKSAAPSPSAAKVDWGGARSGGGVEVEEGKVP